MPKSARPVVALVVLIVVSVALSAITLVLAARANAMLGETHIGYTTIQNEWFDKELGVRTGAITRIPPVGHPGREQAIADHKALVEAHGVKVGED